MEYSDIANKITDQIQKELFPNGKTDKPLYKDLFKEIYPGMTVDGIEKIWLEPNEFYEIFEKALNDNIKNEIEQKEVLQFLKPFYHHFPPYVLTKKRLKYIETEEYTATKPIIKRALYLMNFGGDAMNLKKDKQMIKIGNELELLLRKDLQKKSLLDEHMKKVLEETD